MKHLRRTIANALILPALLLVGCVPSRVMQKPRDLAPMEVMVIATLHGAHANNARYTYDDLYQRIERFAPDVIGVEIRQEDIGAEPAYLARNYPLEMRVLAEKYAPIVVGIDWLGSELEGRPVPAKYWREESEIKRLERAMSEETGYSSTKLDEIEQAQSEILAEATPVSLNDGRYDQVTQEYYRIFADLVTGTPYARLSEFYYERDRRIDDRASSIVERHQNEGMNTKRIVFVVGADHRGPLVAELSKRFKRTIKIMPVQ